MSSPSFVAAWCLLHRLPLFFRAAPKTPLRVLGIVALDMLHVLRDSQALTPATVGELAMFLDFAGYANAAWDHKTPCDAEYRTSRQRLETAGHGVCIDDYLHRLRELESRRPSIGGDWRRFDEVRWYREAVARLTLATAAAIGRNTSGLDTLDTLDNLDGAIQATWSDSDLNALFRTLMQCQIVDDVLDYATDRAAGLPSFLTAARSLPEALEWTADAVRSYAAGTKADAVFPVRVVLWLVTAATTLVVRAADWRHRHARQFASALEGTYRGVGPRP